MNRHGIPRPPVLTRLSLSVLIAGVVLCTPPAAAGPNRPDAAASAAPQHAPAELSVAPLDHVEYPSDRPAWLERVPQTEPLAEVWTVLSGPSDTPEQSGERLRLMTRAAVAEYAKRLTGAEDARFWAVSDGWIDRVLVEQRYAGTLTRGDTRLHESAVRLQFSPRVQEEIRAAWREAMLQYRLTLVAAAVATAVVLLMATSALLGLLCGRGERPRSPETAA